MLKKPKISIIILNFNRNEFLDRAIRSCLNQEIIGKNIEILVVDDASTDESNTTIEYFKKNYLFDLIHIKLKKNMGAGYCSNLAVKKSRGEFVIRVDSDDYIGKLAIETMSNLLINNDEISYVYGDILKIDKKGRRLDLVKLNSKKTKYDYGAGMMFRKKTLNRIGNYNKNLREAEDYDLLKRLDNKGVKSFYLPIPFYRYYIHGKNTSLSGKRKRIIKELKLTYES